MKPIHALVRLTARVTATAALFPALLIPAGAAASAEEPVFNPNDVVVYPSSETLEKAEGVKSTDYRVWANGKEVFCHKSYVFTTDKHFWESRPPTTNVTSGTPLWWEGSNGNATGRPVTPLTYCSFDFQNKVEIKVTFEESLRDAKHPVTKKPFIKTGVVDVRPLSAGIRPMVTTVSRPDGTTSPGITFTLDANAPCELVRMKSRAANSPCQLSIEPGRQTKYPLHLFANPMETNAPAIGAEHVKVMKPNSADDLYHSAAEMKLTGKQNTLYFAPGVHHVDPILLTANRDKANNPKYIYRDVLAPTTIYVAGGAIVYLRPQVVPAPTDGKPRDKEYNREWAFVSPLIKSAEGVNNVTVAGRGILSGKLALDGKPGEDLTQRATLISLNWGHTGRVEGVTLDEPGDKALVFNNLNRDAFNHTATVHNVKVIGHFGNSDAIVFAGTFNGLVENSFAHNGDNGMQVKSFWGHETRNIEFRNNVVWSDAVGSFGLFGEAEANIRDVTYRDSVVIHMTGYGASPAVGLMLTGAGTASNFLFENIVVEHTTCRTCAPIKVINNWNDWSLSDSFSERHAEDPYFPTTGDASKVDKLRKNGDIRTITFTNVDVLNAENEDVVIEPYDEYTPIDNVSFQTVSVNQRPIINPSYPHLYVNGRVVNTQQPVAWKGITNTSMHYQGCLPDDRGECMGALSVTPWRQPPPSAPSR